MFLELGCKYIYMLTWTRHVCGTEGNATVGTLVHFANNETWILESLKQLFQTQWDCKFIADGSNNFGHVTISSVSLSINGALVVNVKQTYYVVHGNNSQNMSRCKEPDLLCSIPILSFQHKFAVEQKLTKLRCPNF